MPSVLTKEIISRHFNKNINEAADELGMCATLLKKIIRQCGISRWPAKKVLSIINILAILYCSEHTNETAKQFASYKNKLADLVQNPENDLSCYVDKTQLQKYSKIKLRYTAEMRNKYYEIYNKFVNEYPNIIENDIKITPDTKLYHKRTNSPNQDNDLNRNKRRKIEETLIQSGYCTSNFASSVVETKNWQFVPYYAVNLPRMQAYGSTYTSFLNECSEEEEGEDIALENLTTRFNFSYTKEEFDRYRESLPPIKYHRQFSY